MPRRLRVAFQGIYRMPADAGAFVVSGKAANLSTGTPSSPSAPASTSLRVQFGTGSEVTWFRSCRPLCWADVGQPTPVDPLAWVNPGGDYRDANDVQNGPTHYATTTPVSSGAQMLTWNVTTLVARLLTDNTGFYVSQSSTGGYVLATKEHPSHPIPALTVITNAGTYNPPLLGDTEVDPSSGGDMSLNTGATDNPLLLKFDLSSVVGVVTSATLSIYAAAFVPPRSMYVDYLDMPALVTDPVTQIGDVEYGIASTAAVDTVLAGHPSVLAYTDFVNAAATDPPTWRSLGATFSIGPTSFVSWSDFGVTAFRSEIGTGVNRGIASEKYTQPEPTYPISFPYQRAIGAGYDELYCRWLIKLDEDIYTGIRDDQAVKLTGMAGLYEETGMLDHGGAYSHTTFSARTEHATRSFANPHVYRLFTYWYGADWPVSVHGGAGLPRYTNLHGFCFRAGQKYSVEQHIKLNTFTGATPNADGVIELWVDGVKVHRETGMTIRTNPLIQIQSAPKAQTYHGGSGPSSYPTSPIHHELASIVTATEYIGPPTRQCTWRPAGGTRVNRGSSTMVSVAPDSTGIQGVAGIGSAMWYSGGAFAPDFGPWGSVIKGGTGHSAYYGNEEYRGDLENGWSRLTNPHKPLVVISQNHSHGTEGEFYADSGGTSIPTQPGAYQRYNTTVVLPPGIGGAGPAGALLSTIRPAMTLNGGVTGARSHILQLHDPAWERYSNNYVTLSQYNLGAATVAAARNKVYLLHAKPDNSICTLDLSTRQWSNPVMTGMEVYGGDYGDLHYLISRDLLVYLQYPAQDTVFAQTQAFVVINPNAPYLATHPTTTGTQPTVTGIGSSVWVEELDRFFVYNFGQPNTLFTLTPPASNPATGVWTWTSETLTGATVVNDSATAQYRRLFWSPKARVLVWLGRADAPLQVWTPQGI